MPNTYTWKIDSIQCEKDTLLDPDVKTDCDIIKSVMWTLTGSNGTVLNSFAGETVINFPTVPEGAEANNSVFNALTEAEVITAVQTALGSTQIDAIKAHMNSDLLYSVGVTSNPTLPWAV